MSVVQEIDAVLYSLNENEQDDVMKKVFVRARQKALDEINELLADFRNKRTLGKHTFCTLDNIYDCVIRSSSLRLGKRFWREFIA